MKKIVLTFLIFFMCFGLLLPPTPAFAEGDNHTYVITANKATVYQDADLTSEKLYTLNHKDEVEIEYENGIAKTYGETDFVFYRIITPEKNGYILRDLAVLKRDFLVTIPKFNAKTNGKATVYFFEEGKYVESNITLAKHQRVFLYEGFNRKKEYNAIAFVYENEVVYGYLKESVIDPDGVNPVIITVACFAIAAIGIILALVFIKKKKTKTGIAKKKNK